MLNWTCQIFLKRVINFFFCKYHTFHIGSPKKFHNNLNRYISYPMQGTSIGLACKNITFRILWKFSLKCFWYLKKWFVSGDACNLQNAILCWHKICIILTHNHHSCGQILFLQFHPQDISIFVFTIHLYRGQETTGASRCLKI